MLTDIEIIRLEKLFKRCYRQELSKVIHDYNEDGIERIVETLNKVLEACKAELGEVNETK